MAKKRSRSKPQVVTTKPLQNGSVESITQSWDEAFGDLDASEQLLVEHNYLFNNFLAKESARATAILAPAYLDAILEEVLRSALKTGKARRAFFLMTKLQYVPCHHELI